MDNAREYLGQTVTVRMDRPLGSRHPEWGFVYPVNYGYIPNTRAADNEELDAYVLGVFEPVNEFSGVCIAVLERLDDNDDKLIVAPKDKGYTDKQIKALTEFQERFFNTQIIRK